ncbi:MAG: hypothetical protein ACI4TX_02440 [Christensenellales bacterium]
MNKIEKGKTALITIGILSLVFSIAFLVLGIVMVVGSFGGENVDVLKLVFGIIFILLFFPLVIIGIYFTWTGAVLKATKGSIAEDNLGKGTVNKALCKNCGAELSGEKFCPNCGKSVTGVVVCEKCGTENKDENSHCKECGCELKK